MHRVPKHMTDRARRLRREATPAERELWKRLSRVRPPFTRQLSVEDRAILDLACRQAMLAVELDGGQHQDQANRDQARTEWLEQRGWRVVRLWNSEVLANPDGAAAHVVALAAERLGFRPEAIASRAGRERKPRR